MSDTTIAFTSFTELIKSQIHLLPQEMRNFEGREQACPKIPALKRERIFQLPTSCSSSSAAVGLPSPLLQIGGRNQYLAKKFPQVTTKKVAPIITCEKDCLWGLGGIGFLQSCFITQKPQKKVCIRECEQRRPDLVGTCRKSGDL